VSGRAKIRAPREAAVVVRVATMQRQARAALWEFPLRPISVRLCGLDVIRYGSALPPQGQARRSHGFRRNVVRTHWFL